MCGLRAANTHEQGLTSTYPWIVVAGSPVTQKMLHKPLKLEKKYNYVQMLNVQHIIINLVLTEHVLIHVYYFFIGSTDLT